ncbi:FliH/SctL family protein [Pseudodesulfovibrio sp.]|uniref:FliH/SctL family protein n=1 Tax=unclassified Pseudodesulfovibrio TaxID=2661612 RepID=UPI003AFFC208
MSLSSHSSDHLTGKVLMGLQSPGPDEMSIQEIEGKRKLIWDDSVNNEYLERVKAKAREAAKEIRVLAELEAEALRNTARYEGYEAGLAQAQADVEAHTQTMSAEVENILGQLQAQGATIFEERRNDIMALIKLAVQKTLAVEMSEKRTASLESLMRQALEKLDSQRQLTIRCAAADAEDLSAFIGSIQERNPALQQWTIKGDATLAEGGVVIESDEGRVDNTIKSRWEGVEPILNQLIEQLTATEG